MNILYVTMIAVTLQHCECGVPGGFITMPENNLNFRAIQPMPALKRKVHMPTLHNILDGRVILINGYGLGTAVLALAVVGRTAHPKYPAMDLLQADFYTNAYQWILRAVSMLPEYFAALPGANYADSQKIWQKRFYYMDEQVPGWIRSILFFVDDWDGDDDLKKRYKLYAKPAFDKHLRFPDPRPSDFYPSFKETQETVENLDDSEAETPAPRLLDWGPVLAKQYEWWELL